MAVQVLSRPDGKFWEICSFHDSLTSQQLSFQPQVTENWWVWNRFSTNCLRGTHTQMFLDKINKSKNTKFSLQRKQIWTGKCKSGLARSQLSHRFHSSPVPLPFIRIWSGGSAQMFPCGSRSGASVVFIYLFIEQNLRGLHAFSRPSPVQLDHRWLSTLCSYLSGPPVQY